MDDPIGPQGAGDLSKLARYQLSRRSNVDGELLFGLVLLHRGCSRDKQCLDRWTFAHACVSKQVAERQRLRADVSTLFRITWCGDHDRRRSAIALAAAAPHELVVGSALDDAVAVEDDHLKAS
jgi:hypothetical protein